MTLRLLETRKKEVCLALGRMLNQQELDLILWLSRRQSSERSKK